MSVCTCVPVHVNVHLCLCFAFSPFWACGYLYKNKEMNNPMDLLICTPIKYNLKNNNTGIKHLHLFTASHRSNATALSFYTVAT